MYKKLLHKTSEKLNKMDQAINGPDPRFVSLQQSGKDIKEIINFDVSDKYCHTYIGKMRKDGGGIYNDKVITALLSFFMKNTVKPETFTIELANIVSEILNDKDSKNEYYSFEEQRKHIIQLAKKLNKRGAKKLVIVDIQDRNPELFEVLKNNGIEGLNNKGKKPELNKDNFNSLDIARYLYRASKKDKEYFMDLKKLKPSNLQEINGNNDYYGLIELSIRINDLLHGIIVQSGVARQKKYDALLLKHINPNDPEYIILKDFKNFCAEILDKQGEEILYGDRFRGLYFDTEKSEMLILRIQEKERIKSKIRYTTSIISALLIGILGTNQTTQYLQSQKLQKQTGETIKEIFENKRATRSGDGGYGEYIGKEKIEQIDKYIQDIYDRFLFRYNSTGQLDEIAFKSKIADCINDQKILDLLGSGYSSEICPVEDIIIDDYIIPRNIGEFRSLGVNTLPYSQYLEYTDAFVNTILLDENFETNRDESIKTMGYRGADNIQKIVEEIGPYSPKYQGISPSTVYVHQLATIKQGGKYYVVATGMYSGKFKQKDNYNLYSSRGREFAIDFLRQTQPVINEVLDQYLIRYYRFYGNSYSMSEDGSFKAAKENLRRDIIELLIKDFLKKGLLHKINEKETSKIVNYLDNFVIENQNTIKSMDLGINTSLLPNGFFDNYEDIMRNTINDKDQSKIKYKNNYIQYSQGKEDLTLNELIGKYRTSDGKMYFVGLTHIGGKKYLCAREEFPSDYYSGRYYNIACGEIISKDYFQTKSNFLQKKLLYDKKAKSASQKHTNVNEKSKPDTFSNYVKNNPKGIVPR